MKLKKILNYDFILEFKELLESDFENKLFVASLRNYCTHGNPLRFHNFAFSMRELVLNMIDSRAPNDKVKDAIWYARESDAFEVTRRQKLKYCAQGFLSDEYLNEYVIEELNESIKDYLKEFRFFNKYTHITEKHFKACPKKFFADMKYIIQRSKEVIEEIDSLENIVINSLEDKIHDPVFEAVIDASPDDLMILANRVFIEQVEPEKLEIEYLEENGIIARVEGTIYVTQEYGPKDDICEISSDYPFSILVEASARDISDITVRPSDFKVDTSSWYE